MSSTQDIRAALETEIANVTGIPPAEQRAWENVGFSPTTNVLWIKSRLIVASQRPAHLGPSPQIRNNGQMLVTINAPENEGSEKADALADAIRGHFTVDDVYSSNGVNVRFNYSERNAGVLSAPWWVVTVTISWYAYTNN